MSRLNVLSSHSPLSIRSKLFAELVTDILRHKKYRIDRILDVSDKKVQIDVLGQFMPTGAPLYAECKCYDQSMPVSELQAFYGRYMAWWHKNKKCRGIVVALPGLDKQGKAFFEEHIKGNPDVAAYFYDNEDVLETISEIYDLVSPELFRRPIARNIGKPGDNVLLYTEKGMFWAQYIASRGNKTPDRIALFNDNGTPLNDPAIREYLKTLYPEFEHLEDISIIGAVHPQPGLFHGKDEIVETAAGSGPFDYHLPAAYQDFVGGAAALAKVDAFINSVRHKTTPLRSLLFAAPPGWGKSSTALACAERLNASGNTVVTIDSRTASSPGFAVRVLDYAIQKIAADREPSEQEVDATRLQEFNGSVESVLQVGAQLERHGRILVVCFDQFDSIFFAPEALRGVENLFLNVSSAQTNVVLCFLWKTHLFELDNGPARSIHRLISEKSEPVVIRPFARDDLTLLFDIFAEETNASINKGLRTSLAKRSQGLPWLLKRWFAYVQTMLRKGNSPSDILPTLPHVETLFQADVLGLSPDERNALSNIAKAAPISIFDADKTFDHQIVQNLLAQKLAIKIGSMCDVYSDVFRNYLINGDLSLISNHVFQTQIADIQKAVKILAEKNGSVDMVDFINSMELPESASTRMVYEMNLLGLTTDTHGNIALLNDIRPARQVAVALGPHLKTRLRHHQPTQLILGQIKNKSLITLEEMSEVLQMTSSYMPATKAAWRKRSRILAEYMDVADMAFWDKYNKVLTWLNPETDIRERDLLLPKRRGSKTPWIQYAYVQEILTRLMQALQNGERVDWDGLGRRSIFKALAALEDLGFINRTAAGLKVLPKGFEFAQNPAKRAVLFAESALKIASFSIFVDLLKTHQDRGNTLLRLGLELRDALGARWTANTAEVVAKILLDWARHAKLAPGVFAEMRKGPIKGWKKKKDRQLPLF